MKTYNLLVALVIFAAFFTGSPALAQTSHVLDTQNIELTTEDYAVKKQAIQNVLESFSSPLAAESEAFLSACIESDIDCYLLPSISGVESTYGKYVKEGTYNPFGWGNGKITFETWSDSFHAVGKGLRVGYLDKGAVTVADVGAIYAANPEWPAKISSTMEIFYQEEEQIRLYSDQFDVE